MPHGPKLTKRKLWERRGYVMVYAVPAAEAVQLPPPPERPKKARRWVDYAIRGLVTIAGAAL